MLSYQKSILDSDSDDDYELPSLADRVKAAIVCQNKNTSPHISSDSDEDESSFLKFKERIQNTPMSQVKFSQEVTSCTKAEVPKILKNVEKNSSPPLNIKLDFSATSESEDEGSECLNPSARIQSAPQIKPLGSCYISSESDSDEVFSNLLERFKITPRTESKENCGSSVRNKVKKMDEFRTPLSPIQKTKVSYKDLDSESDESFTNFVEILRTPLSVNRKVTCKAVDSESDESFTNFVERLRTPLSVNKNIQHKENEVESDDSFLNNTRKHLVFKTPRSQKKNSKDADLLSSSIEAKQCNYPLLDATNSLKISKSENEKEFIALFQPESISSTFLRKRESYTRKLYEFYNRKVFNSQLPIDMPLIYNGALKTTAGMTCCCVKNGTYLCTIKLSSSLLNSFDRLKETLLHEMCHAAVWIINKQRKVHHGPLWQIWASRCKLILPFIDCPRRCHSFDISYSVWYQCLKCQWKTGRCKQVKKYHGALCKRCKTPITVTYA